MKAKKIISILLAISLVTGVTAVMGTKAYFTSSTESAINTFKAGTLKIGGEGDYKFKRLVVDNIKPGMPLDAGDTTVKNIGSLPLKLFRITASNFSGSRDLDYKLKVTIKMNNDTVYTGRLMDLIAVNGGYFDPIYDIKAGQEVNIHVDVEMDEDAGNYYQDKTIKCDLTIDAAQNNYPELGKPKGRQFDIASATGSGTERDPSFSVKGWNEVLDNGYVSFKYNWKPSDWKTKFKFGTIVYKENFEVYDIEIKHEKSIDDANIGGEHEGKWLKIFFRFRWDESSCKWICTSPDSDININPNDVVVDFENDMIKIKKSVFPEDWKGFEVKFHGIQREDKSFRTTEWKYWSLDRN